MNNDSGSAPIKKKYVRSVGPRLRIVLFVVLGLYAVLGANSAYLVVIRFLEWYRSQTYQNYFYQAMFLAHLVLGLLIILPVVVFGIFHIKNSYDRPNRRAVRVGYGLFIVSLILLITGVALMRLDFFELKDPRLRSLTYWAHFITPLMAVWLYILHRMSGPRIKWNIGLGWTVAVGVIVLTMAAMHSQDPRKWNVAGPKEGEKYFHPSLARTASGNFIPARTLMMDDYCKSCHPDTYKGWFHSAHRFSSFNNEAYLFSIKETREVAFKRDGNVKSSRWCAGCHDVVPFFSGAFDDPNFDVEKHPTAKAGITCTSCHAITHVNSTVGNGDYTIEEPIHYPFAFSTNKVLQFINQQLVKGKPDFHKKTFLKPLHKTAEFCSTCHKVSLPNELTKYKDFLRGQNHYDTYLLSGVSGHGAKSFYYPDKAKKNCAECHMPLQLSQEFGADYFNATNQSSRYVHNHVFVGANTALAHFHKDDETVKAHQNFLKDCVRVDVFGIKEGGTIDSPLQAPLRPNVPALKPGGKYLIEIVLRTLRVGHPLTQGTVDSNELWVDVEARSGNRIVGRSGGLDDRSGVDPWSHFANVYMLDRTGNRIDRRNPQDIFTPLYNNQIPPGAAAVVHYAFTVPRDATEPITFEAKFNYRKFDTIYMQHVFGTNFINDLPITVMAGDKITFPIVGVAKSQTTNPPSQIPEWQRWNDYGIGLLLKGDKGSEKGELIQASNAFAEVEKLGRADGPVNQARVFFKEGRLEDAVAALQRAGTFDPPAPRWVAAWFTGLVNKQNGYLDKAIADFRSILEDRYPEQEQRGFDFTKDYEVINELGQTLYERAKLERGEANKSRQRQFLDEAMAQFERTLKLDSENLTAHYNLALIHAQLVDESKAAAHRALHERFRPDDNARDVAIAAARRRDKAADHATQAIVIYDLQRPGAPGLSTQANARVAQAESGSRTQR
ncbi:MAG: hypothetical protein EXS31_18740 [Pedosphaera sp.]|nr:hypothetical protein [Pedosphaera sp.]